MAEIRKVTLSRAYEGSSSARTPIREIAFREPTWRDFIAIGEIAEMQPIGTGGAGVIVRNFDAIEKYAERCLVAGDEIDAGFLQRLALADAMRVEETFTDFFRQARASASSVTNSSGASAGDPPTSGS